MDRTTKFENVDFEDNRRYARHEAKAEVQEPIPIYPYMPWYTPTDKYMHVWDYRTGNQFVINPVAERGKKLAAHIGGKVADPAMQFERQRRHVADIYARMSAEEKQKITDEINEATRRQEELRRQEALRAHHYGVG